jgi:signal transduction histidine kinase
MGVFATRPGRSTTSPQTVAGDTNANHLAVPQLTLTLRSKTLLIVALVVTTFLVALYIPLRAYVLSNAATLEEQRTRQDVERTLQLLASDVTELGRTTQDYAAWDETYAFVTSGEPAYIASNFNDQMYATNAVNLVLILDGTGAPVYARFYDYIADEELSLDQLIAFAAAQADPVTAQRSAEGVLVLPNGPLLLAVRPIIKSNYEGTPNGTLIMGRLVNDAEMQRLRELLRLNMTFQPVTAATTDGISVVARDELTYVGTGLVRDFLGKPGFVVAVETPRDVTSGAQQTVVTLGLGLLVIGVLFSLVILVLLELAVLRRVALLSAEVSAIGEHPDATVRVSESGSDELGRLAQTINWTLGALEQAQRERDRLFEERIGVKHQFIATVSHELRTPLTPISGYIDLLLLDGFGRLNEEQRQALQVVKVNAGRMGGLVDDLLEVARSDAGVVIHRDPANVRTLVEETAALFRPLCDARQQSLELLIDGGLPQVPLDARRMAQVLNNLLSNAIKYTPIGGRISVRARAQASGWLTIEVEDTGIGLTPEQQQRLFTPFYRADSPMRNDVEGTGLGLYVSRSIVRQHGGDLTVRSTSGSGSVFTVMLPLSATGV